MFIVEIISTPQTDLLQLKFAPFIFIGNAVVGISLLLLN